MAVGVHYKKSMYLATITKIKHFQMSISKVNINTRAMAVKIVFLEKGGEIFIYNMY